MFLDEARMLRRHIVPAYEVGWTDDDIDFLVMECVDGQTDFQQLAGQI